MNENESYSSTAQAIGALPPRKKPGKPALLIGAAILCAVAVAAVGIKMLSAPAPKAAVEAAFTATDAQQQAAVKRIYENIPAAKPLFEGRRGALSGSFDLTVKSVEDNPYAAFANVILKDAAIVGSFDSDPENETSAGAFSVVLQDAQLLDLKFFLSPELAVAGVPTMGRTINFNPTTFAQDYQNSALGAVSPLDAQSLAAIQGVINGQTAYLNALGTLSTERLQADLLPILKGALNNAAYTYDRQSKNYVVTIPGADLKSAIAGCYRYIYFDSELGRAMAMTMDPIAATSGQSYETMMDETITDLEKSLPESDAVLTLDIKSGLIKTARMAWSSEATPEASSAPEAAAPSGSAITSLVFDCGFDATANTVKLAIDTDGGADMTVDASGVFKDNAYTLDMTVAVDSKEATMTLPMTVRLTADGAYSCTADLTVNTGGDPIKAGLAFDGTALLEQEVLTLHLPDSRVYLSGSGAATGALIFDLNCTDVPLAQTPVPPESASLFSMDAQQLSQLGDEYAVGYENLVGRLLSLLMG